MITERRDRRWRWFAAWMLAGICLAFGVTALGVFIAPVGLLLVVLLLLRQPGLEALGAVIGVGAIISWLGSRNLDYHSCPARSPTLILRPGGPSSASFSCGGVDGTVWLIAGILVVVIALTIYLLMTRSRAPRGDSQRLGSVSA